MGKLIEGAIKALRLWQMCNHLSPSLAFMRNPLMFSGRALLLFSFETGLDCTVFCKFLFGMAAVYEMLSLRRTSEQLQTSHRIT